MSYLNSLLESFMANFLQTKLTRQPRLDLLKIKGVFEIVNGDRHFSLFLVFRREVMEILIQLQTICPCYELLTNSNLAGIVARKKHFLVFHREAPVLLTTILYPNHSKVWRYSDVGFLTSNTQQTRSCWFPCATRCIREGTEEGNYPPL